MDVVVSASRLEAMVSITLQKRTITDAPRDGSQSNDV